MWMMLGLIPNIGLAGGIMGIAALAIIFSPFIFLGKGISYVAEIAQAPGMAISSGLFLVSFFLLIFALVSLFRKKWVHLCASVAIITLAVTYILSVSQATIYLTRYYDVRSLDNSTISLSVLENPALKDELEKAKASLQKQPKSILRKYGMEGYAYMRLFLGDLGQLGFHDYKVVCAEQDQYFPFYKKGEEFFKINKDFEELNKIRKMAGLSPFTKEHAESCTDIEKASRAFHVDIKKFMADEFALMKSAYEKIEARKAPFRECGGNSRETGCIFSGIENTLLVSSMSVTARECSSTAACKMVAIPQPLGVSEPSSPSLKNRLISYTDLVKAREDIKNDKMTTALCKFADQCQYLLWGKMALQD